MIKERSSQEEMVGFVLIIVLVSVIALVFLAISLRKPAEAIDSLEIENFLHSVLMFTSSCQETPENLLNFKDLVGACYKNEKCLDGNESCDVLNETARGLVENGFSAERYKGYVLRIYDDNNETLLYMKKGNETRVKYGSEVYFNSYETGGNVYVRFRLFY